MDPYNALVITPFSKVPICSSSLPSGSGKITGLAVGRTAWDIRMGLCRYSKDYDNFGA